MRERYDILVVGGGHAGVEAAWAAANLFASRSDEGRRIGLITLRADRVGEMSCNPAIGGLAKGQLVREIDALGGLMGLAADATGIHFKVLNTSKGPAVHGPRSQNDKHAYAEAVRALIASRAEIEVIEGAVERLLVREGSDGRVIEGVEVAVGGSTARIDASAVVLTTGTFMRGLMHTGETQTAGGRVGEGAASAISDALRGLGFELGRLKTGTPPRLRRSSLDWDGLEPQGGDERPKAFSELSGRGGLEGLGNVDGGPMGVVDRFPLIEQVECRRTHTTVAGHEAIRANLHRAPMFSGQIASTGPRYCPSIEDKVVRFADRESHGVFLEPESLRDEWVYCNGISSSLPADVQDVVVRSMPGCERAEILRYGYAVEYDMSPARQIHATGETKLVGGLFFAGQINGTSGYEEAAAQGLVAGVNAARRAVGEDADFTLGRDEAYIGVLMDDLVTKTPVEPYRMFTSRAEHRLLLRSDNAPDRLTPIAERLGLLDGTALGRRRLELFRRRRATLDEAARLIDAAAIGGRFGGADFGVAELGAIDGFGGMATAELMTAWAERHYEPYVRRQLAEIKRSRAMEEKRAPAWLDYRAIDGLRAEAREALVRFRPATFGQAGRLEGVTPADLSLIMVYLRKNRGRSGASA